MYIPWILYGYNMVKNGGGGALVTAWSGPCGAQNSQFLGLVSQRKPHPNIKSFTIKMLR